MTYLRLVRSFTLKAGLRVSDVRGIPPELFPGQEISADVEIKNDFGIELTNTLVSWLTYIDPETGQEIRTDLTPQTVTVRAGGTTIAYVPFTAPLKPGALCQLCVKMAP